MAKQLEWILQESHRQFKEPGWVSLMGDATEWDIDYWLWRRLCVCWCLPVKIDDDAGGTCLTLTPSLLTLCIIGWELKVGFSRVSALFSSDLFHSIRARLTRSCKPNHSKWFRNFFPFSFHPLQPPRTQPHPRDSGTLFSLFRLATLLSWRLTSRWCQLTNSLLFSWAHAIIAATWWANRYVIHTQYQCLYDGASGIGEEASKVWRHTPSHLYGYSS